ncbi:hypothetical protein Q3G72_023195 [Acer saccharum]|nr:hypothetical protein Q3G72_023195 [Acer saccharum]
MSDLSDIIMPNNNFIGPIPVEFCQLENLEVLDLLENNISSDFPSCLNSHYFQQVHLSRNKLKGQLKEAFYSSSYLKILDLSYNHFDGSIPKWIGRLSQLSYLILSNNNFDGEMPCLLDQLRLIYLSCNNLSGHIPPSLDMTTLHDKDYDVAPSPMSTAPSPAVGVGSAGPSVRKGETIEFTTKSISYSYKGRILNYLSGIDLSCNKLTDEIPHQVGNLTRIHSLNLSHNELSRPIPPSFLYLMQIESLDLSYNYLNGKIPTQLVELYDLPVFSVAHNNLVGKTPERIAQFGTFGYDSYEGNLLLCGLSLPKSCDTTESPSSILGASTEDGEDSNFMDMDIFYISFTISYVTVLLVIAAVLCINPYWRRTWFYLTECG